MERLYRQLKVDGEEVARLRVAAVKPPFVAVSEDSPSENLRFVEIIADLLMWITLLAFADLRERVIYLFSLEDCDGRAVAMRGVLVDDSFLFRIVREEDVVWFEVLFRFGLGEVVGPAKAKLFQNFVEQFLTRESFVVLRAGDVAFFVKRFAKLPRLLRLGVARPPRIAADTCLQVMV